MANKKIRKRNIYLNTYPDGGLLGKFSSWNKDVTGKFMDSGIGQSLGSLGIKSGGLGGIANAAGSMVTGLMNPNGNTTGVGNALQTVGSLASNIPGVGGLIGAGVGVVGGLINTMFGSNINEEFVDRTEDLTKQQGNFVSGASDNASLLADWGSHTNMAHVSKSDVGSDGWFSDKAKNTTKRLNRQIDEANKRAWASLENTMGNIDTQNDLNVLANFSAYGGPLGFIGGALDYELAKENLGIKALNAANKSRITSMPNSFESPELNTFAKGGKIHIKPENRGKFTEYCGGKVTSECIAKGKRSKDPAVRKRATFAANSRKWKHAGGGPLNPYNAGSLVDALYQSFDREDYLGEPLHRYDFTIPEEEADRLGYKPDYRGHRDDRVKKPAHPTHKSRGKWNSFEEFELTDKGMDNSNYTLFGLNDGGQDPQAVMTYKGGIVLPELTVTPEGNYVYNPYDNIKMGRNKKAEGGPLNSRKKHNMNYKEGDIYDVTEEEIKILKELGYEFEYV